MAGRPTERGGQQYPIGPCPKPQRSSSAEREAALDSIECFPAQLATALDGLNDTHLETPYRAGSWNIRTLVHHLADCHLIAYTWTRLALTSDETWPMVYDYNVDALAALPDQTLSPEVSLKLLTAIHQRWSALLYTIPLLKFTTHGYTHPETGPCSLDQTIAMYAWHGSHHLGHIMHCRERNGWK